MSDISDNIKDIRNAFMEKGDIEGLEEFDRNLLLEMRKNYNERVNKRVERDMAPQTNLKDFRIEKGSIEQLDIELYIIKTYVEPKCPFCEAFPLSPDYKWLMCEESSYKGGIL